jgi:hypothetical protein
MTKMRVTAYRGGLNFRSQPELDPANIRGQLFLLQTVDVLGPAQNGFMPCTATIGGAQLQGFASAKFLRPMLTPQREALLDQVHIQHERFKRGLGQEHRPPFAGFVGEMWRAIGMSLDGTDRDQPWSAAAISFMVRNAGPAYARFRFAAAHSKFTHEAIQARRREDREAPFWGRALFEVRPQPGDIVVRDNPDFAPSVDFEFAAHSDSYRSHSDIVVHVDSEGQKLIAIGGNVSQSVAIAEYKLAPGDFLSPAGQTFALLVNRADDVVA